MMWLVVLFYNTIKCWHVSHSHLSSQRGNHGDHVSGLGEAHPRRLGHAPLITVLWLMLQTRDNLDIGTLSLYSHPECIMIVTSSMLAMLSWISLMKPTWSSSLRLCLMSLRNILVLLTWTYLYVTSTWDRRLLLVSKSMSQWSSNFLLKSIKE